MVLQTKDLELVHGPPLNASALDALRRTLRSHGWP